MLAILESGYLQFVPIYGDRFVESTSSSSCIRMAAEEFGDLLNFAPIGHTLSASELLRGTSTRFVQLSVSCQCKGSPPIELYR